MKMLRVWTGRELHEKSDVALRDQSKAWTLSASEVNEQKWYRHSHGSKTNATECCFQGSISNFQRTLRGIREQEEIVDSLSTDTTSQSSIVQPSTALRTPQQGKWDEEGIWKEWREREERKRRTERDGEDGRGSMRHCKAQGVAAGGSHMQFFIHPYPLKQMGTLP